MDIIRSDFDAKFQTKECCCCLSLKTGATVIGLLDTISVALMISMLSYEKPVEPYTPTDDEREFSVKIRMAVERAVNMQNRYSNQELVAKILMSTILGTIHGSMIYGNIKGDKRWMLPHVYLGLIQIIMILLVLVVGGLSFIFTGLIGVGFLVVFLMTLMLYVNLYLWEVVRCRVLELDQMEQPPSCPQPDPEMPVSGYIQAPNPMVSYPSQEKVQQEKMALAYPDPQLHYE